MPTLKVSSADRGRTLANNGVLTGLRYIDAPDAFGDGLFTLVDDYLPGYPPKQIYNVDVNTSCWMMPQNTRRGTGGIPSMYVPLIAGASIPFVSLMLARIPVGASFEIDVQ
jgi:hypothetical protein